MVSTPPPVLFVSYNSYGMVRILRLINHLQAVAMVGATRAPMGITRMLIPTRATTFGHTRRGNTELDETAPT